MKNKRIRKILIVLVIFLVIGIGAITLIIKFVKDNKAIGEYTGYQMILLVSYSGSGIQGQDLGHGKYSQKYNIDENDVYVTQGFGGKWKLLDEETVEETKKMENKIEATDSKLEKMQLEIEKIQKFNYSEICKIIRLNQQTVEIETKLGNQIAKYNEEISVPSNAYIMDGINYYYKVKFIKK